MPIRINLLAEAQAAEEIRRKDPVKRGAWVAVFLILLVLVWSSSLRIKLMTSNISLNRLQGSLSSRTNQYVKILNDQKKLEEVTGKLAALGSLATNRFLYGDMLNALMRTTTDGVQLMHFRTDQSYSVAAEERPTKTGDGRTIPGKPASATESVLLGFDARDLSANPGGDNVNRYKEAIAHSPYFAGQNISTDNIKLKNLSPPQVDTDSGLSFVLFSFELRYPGRVPPLMKKISKEKQIHLVLLGVATLGIMAGLWFFLINGQKSGLVAASKKIEETRSELEKTQKVVKGADQIESDLKAATAKLDAIESGMAYGDIFSCMVQDIKKFNTPAYKVEMPQIGMPAVGEVLMIPNFPYAQAGVIVSGNAYYWDLGKFIADFENRFPYMRIEDLDLQPSGGDEREKLTFRMNIVALVKPGKQP